MPPPDPGRMDRKIRIERQIETRDSQGSGESIPKWVPVANVWAEKVDVAGRERFTASQRFAEVDATWRIWWRADVDPTCRIVVSEGRGEDLVERAYGIVAVNEIGRREGLEILSSGRGELEANRPAQLHQ